MNSSFLDFDLSGYLEIVIFRKKKKLLLAG